MRHFDIQYTRRNLSFSRQSVSTEYCSKLVLWRRSFNVSIGLDKASCPGRWSQPIVVVLRFSLATYGTLRCLTQTYPFVYVRRAYCDANADKSDSITKQKDTVGSAHHSIVSSAARAWIREYKQTLYKQKTKTSIVSSAARAWVCDLGQFFIHEEKKTKNKNRTYQNACCRRGCLLVIRAGFPQRTTEQDKKKQNT